MLVVCKWDRTPKCTACEWICFCLPAPLMFWGFLLVSLKPHVLLVLTTSCWKGELCIVRILDLCIPHVWCHVQTFLKCPHSNAVKCTAPFFYLLSGIHWAINGRLLECRWNSAQSVRQSLSLDSMVWCHSFKSWTGVTKQVFMGFHCYRF